MCTIAEMSRRFDKVDLTKLTGDAMEDNESKIVELNREQLSEGKDSKGYDITPKYTAFTVMKKMEKGQPFDKVTLKDTGSFQAKIELNRKGNTFDMQSSDSKAPDLRLKYGVDIEGLSISGKKETWVICKPDVVGDIKDITGCK